MGSSIGLTTRMTVDAPQYSEASSVVSKIESQIGKIGDLFADVQALLNEIRAKQAEAPDRNDPKYWTSGSHGQKVFNDQAFAADLAKFQAELNQLNQRLESTYRKLGQAQALLQRIQGQELPAAERRDAERIQKAAEAAQKAMDEAIQALDDARKNSEAGGSDSSGKVEIRALEKKLEIKLDSDPSFKEIIHAFALMAQMIGDGSESARASKTVRMPAGVPGGGLPPVGTP